MCIRDSQVHVARRATGRADLALPGELDPGARLHTGGDVNVQGATAAHPALTGALRAGVGDHGAEPVAGGTGAGGHHLAEERPCYPLDHAVPAADLAGARRRAGPAAGALAGRADDCGVDGHVAAGAESRIGQIELQPDQGVLAAPGARDRSAPRRGTGAEERLEDVLEAEAGTEPATVGRGRVDAAVVHLALLGVREHLVGP